MGIRDAWHPSKTQVGSCYNHKAPEIGKKKQTKTSENQTCFFSLIPIMATTTKLAHLQVQVKYERYCPTPPHDSVAHLRGKSPPWHQLHVQVNMNLVVPPHLTPPHLPLKCASYCKR